MKAFSIITAALLIGAAVPTFAEESTGEAATAKAHDVKRSAKKGMHRADEALCAKGDAKCLAEKAKHRGQEGKDYVEDKAKETKNKID